MAALLAYASFPDFRIQWARQAGTLKGHLYTTPKKSSVQLAAMILCKH